MLAEVVIDRLSFRFDRPLTYSVPDRLMPRARVGSIVRVPLRSTRVRGWIVGVHEGQDQATLPIASVSGAASLFDQHLLQRMHEMARRYVAPLPSLLRLLTPPRMGRGRSGAESGPKVGPEAGEARPDSHRLHESRRVVWRPALTSDVADEYAGMVEEVLARGPGAMVLVPEVREGSRVLDYLVSKFPGEAAVVHSGQDPADRSKALWAVALGEKRLVLGSRAAVFSPGFNLGLIIVHNEHDRSFKEQRAPYYDAREVALARSDDADVFLVSETPSLATLQRANSEWTIKEADRTRERASWPAVELIEPPKTGMSRRAVAAIIEARRRGERALVLLPRARSNPSGPGPDRILEFISRVVPEARVSRADRAALESLGAAGSLPDVLESDVVVATEAALAEVERPAISTAIALDADVLLHRPVGRAAEDGLHTLWALAALAGRMPQATKGTRGRVLVETRSPAHHVLQALTRGDYHYFAQRELDQRRASNSPPFTHLVVLRASRFVPETLTALGELAGTELLGPVEGVRGMEVLLKVDSLEPILDPLRDIVSSVPGILVEVDPRDW